MKKLLLFVLLFSAVACTKQAPDFADVDKTVWKQWIYEGDSITDLSSGIPFNYPYQLPLLSKNIALSKQVNVAKSGDQIRYMLDEYASQVHPFRRAADSTGNYAFALMAGSNDAGSGRSSVQIYEDLKREWSYARADGFKVIAFCITRTTAYNRDTTATAVNKLIISDKSLYDYLIRTDMILPDPTNQGYFSDGLHPTAAGSIIIANEIIRVINTK